MTVFQSAADNKVRAIDNCEVLDLDLNSVGATVFPRDIEVRPGGDDGPRMTAIWDGSIGLAVNDFCLCHEYGGQAAWRVASVGGDQTGSLRVFQLYEADFEAVAMVADAAGNITINGSLRTFTIPTDMIHAGDPDTKWSFTADQVEITVGGVSLLTLREAGQEKVTLGAGSGDVDIDFNGDMFLQGSSGFLSINRATPATRLDITHDVTATYAGAVPSVANQTVAYRNSSDGANIYAGFFFNLTGNSKNRLCYMGAISESASTQKASFVFGTDDAGSRTEKMRITGDGDVGIGTLSPNANLDVNGGAIIGATFETDGERVIASETLTTTTSMAATVELAILNSATAKTVTLPAHKVDKLIRLTSIAAGVWTLSPTSGNIKGSGTATLNNGEDIILYSDGTNWI